MRSAQELRAESRRLRETIKDISDLVLKQQLASQALELALQVEAIADLSEDLESVRAKIERYRRMLLASDGKTEAHKQTIENLLRDASEILQQLTAGRAA